MDWILDFYNYRVVAQFIPEFTRGFLSTVGISAVSLILALVLGILTALMSLSAKPLLRNISAAYIAFIRSTPLLVQIYVIYFALPALPILGRRLDEWEGGVLALGLNAGAFMSEIIRAGIQSVDRGQVEGAMSVGMNYAQRMRLPVEIVDEPARRNAVTGPENRIEIGLAGGHSLRITGSYDAEALARLIRGLSA